MQKGVPMPDTSACKQLPLPKKWQAQVRRAVLQAITMAHAAVVHVRGMFEHQPRRDSAGSKSRTH